MIDDKMSDTSFSYNLNDLIGSIDEKAEIKKMKD